MKRHRQRGRIGLDAPWVDLPRDPFIRGLSEHHAAVTDAIAGVRADLRARFAGADDEVALFLRPDDGGLTNGEVRAALTGLIADALHDRQRLEGAAATFTRLVRLCAERDDPDDPPPPGWSGEDRFAVLAFLLPPSSEASA